MPATKSVAVVQDWKALSPGSWWSAGDIDVSTSFKAGLAVVVCPIEAVAHANGTLVRVMGRFGANDEDWRVLYDLRMGAGTAATVNVDVEEAAEAFEIHVDSTTDFETLGDRYLVHNTVAVANSELITNGGFTNDDVIALTHGLANTQETSANLYNIVAEKYFPLPDEVSMAQVLFLNDDADCDVLVRVDVARITAVA